MSHTTMWVMRLLVVVFVSVGVESQCDIGGVLQNLDFFLPEAPTVTPAGNMLADGSNAIMTIPNYKCDNLSCSGTTLTPLKPVCAKGLMGFTLSLPLQNPQATVDTTILANSFNSMFNPEYDATSPKVIGTDTSTARVDITPKAEFQNPEQLRLAIEEKYSATHQNQNGISTVYTPTGGILLEVISSHNPCDPAQIHKSMKSTKHPDLVLSFVNCQEGQLVRPGGRVSCNTTAPEYYCDTATCIGKAGIDSWDPPNPLCNIAGENLQFELYLVLDAPPDAARIEALTQAFNEVYGSDYALIGGKPQSASENTLVRFDILQSKADQSLNQMKIDIEERFARNGNAAKFGVVTETRVNAAPGMPLRRSQSTPAPPQSTPAPTSSPSSSDFNWLPVILGIAGGLLCIIFMFLAWRLKRMLDKKKQDEEKNRLEIREEMLENLENDIAGKKGPRTNFYKALDDYALPGRSVCN